MTSDSHRIDFTRFPENSRVEANKLHEFIGSVLLGIRPTLVEQGNTVRVEYRRMKVAAIVCRVTPLHNGAVLEFDGQFRRAPRFTASSLVQRREREIAEVLLRIVGEPSSRIRRRPAGTQAPSEPQPTSTPDDVPCPVCSTRVWLWKLDEHAAIAHGVRLDDVKTPQAGHCIVCFEHLRLETINSHVCPDRSRSVYTVSGGLPGGGKRR